MIHRLIFLLFIVILHSNAVAQNTIDHWESLVNADNDWKYFLGNTEPPAHWLDTDFNDDTWQIGKGGFGYGDEDDGTIIEPTSSVFLRIKFTVGDLSLIEKVILLADYDDAFVAYLNGNEIARSGITGDRPKFDQYADSQHEALLYQGLYPEAILYDSESLNQIISEGENVLAVQIHNISNTSSDLSSNFFLAVGMNTDSIIYQQVPEWFKEPISVNNSNLPIIKINTMGSAIPDEPKIMATMKIIDNGPGLINNIDDPINGYNGNIGIELRGSSSMNFPKKQYAVELWTANGEDTSASILGLPKEEDWILSAPYSDKSLIRNVLTYKLGEALGRYAPRTKLCELYLNNEYMGVYVLTEKIKRDKNRVDINKLNEEENDGDDLTGGYIIKIDKFTASKLRLNWESPYTPPNQGTDQKIRFQFHYPKEDIITIEQKKYIQDYITQFEHVLAGPKFRGIENGYRKLINTASFIDFAIINELTRNVDGYRLSTFLYKDKDSKGGKLTIGPLWDYNLAFGNADYCKGGETSGWAWDFNYVCDHSASIPFWWKKFLKDPNYINQFQNRWFDLRKGSLSNAGINSQIDSLTTILNEPQQRNFEKWPVLSKYIWPNNYVGNTYENEITYLKNWITERLTWLDTNIAALEIVTDLDKDQSINDEITIYPNPNNGNFNIHFGQYDYPDLNISLYNNLGKLIYIKRFIETPATNLQINTEGLDKGIYLINISSEKKLILSEKLILK